MNNFDFSRFKNYGLWLSLISLIPLVLSAFGVNVATDKIQPIINTILTILVALGILNNPTTDTKGYLDDSKEKQ